MSLSLICPTCTETVTFHHGEVNACPHCGVQFDEKLRKQATASLALQAVGRPVLITIGGVLATMGCGITLLVLLQTIGGVGEYTINNQTVSAGEFFRSGGYSFILHALLSGIISYAIWSEREWGRILMLLSWVLYWAFTTIAFWQIIDVAQVIINTVFHATAFGLAAWYLYGSERVKSYYKFLEIKAEAKSVSSTPTAPSASPK